MNGVLTKAFVRFCLKQKSRLKETLWDGYHNRGTTQIAYLKYATSRAPTSPMLLRSSHGRSLPAQMRFRTSGSEAIGHCVHLLSAHSSRRLSENVGTRPSSSLPFIWNYFCIAEYYNTLQNFVNLFFAKGSGTGLWSVERGTKNERRGCSAIWIKNWTKSGANIA